MCCDITTQCDIVPLAWHNYLGHITGPWRSTECNGLYFTIKTQLMPYPRWDILLVVSQYVNCLCEWFGYHTSPKQGYCSFTEEFYYVMQNNDDNFLLLLSFKRCGSADNKSLSAFKSPIIWLSVMACYTESQIHSNGHLLQNHSKKWLIKAFRRYGFMCLSKFFLLDNFRMITGERLKRRSLFFNFRFSSHFMTPWIFLGKINLGGGGGSGGGGRFGGSPPKHF